jgi:hypothetical protein
MGEKTSIKWLRRIVSTAVMMSVFFLAFVGGFAVFFNSNLVGGVLTLIYIIVGLIVSRKLWV